MSGATFSPGSTMVRPGAYINITNTNSALIPSLGTVAALFKSDWGPFTPVVLSSYDSVIANFGSTGGIDAAQQAFVGGAFSVVGVRVGTGGSPAAATCTLVDTTGSPINVVTITAKWQGTRGNGFTATTRVNLLDATKHDVVISEGVTILQTFTYTPGADEAAAFVAAVTAAGSSWITAVKLAAGNGIFATVASKVFAGGISPTATGADYTTGLGLIRSLDWNIAIVDSEDESGGGALSLLQGFIDQVRVTDGKFVMGVVGEQTNVSAGTRNAHSLATADYAMVYVTNGFTNTAGTVFEGYRAAARLAGVIASTPITRSITHIVIPDAVSVTGSMTNSDVINAINNGAVCFTVNARKQVQIEYGITTLTTPPANLDNGWKKIRRVRTRDFLVGSIISAWDPMIGQVPNNTAGQNALAIAAQAVISRLTNQGSLISGTIVLDPNNAPAGDSVWFAITVQDTDSAEHIYLTIGFQF